MKPTVIGLDVDLLARAMHSAAVSVPCPWWQHPFSECPMAGSHLQRAEAFAAEYERIVEAER